jgi:hypothetical protein
MSPMRDIDLWVSLTFKEESGVLVASLTVDESAGGPRLVEVTLSADEFARVVAGETVAG